MNSNKVRMILWVTVGIILLALPILTNQLMTFRWFKVVGDEKTWIAFYGSYLGGIIGGLMTLAGVLLTLNVQTKNKHQEDEVNEHKTLLMLYPKFLLIKSNLKDIRISLENNHQMTGKGLEWNKIERDMFKWRINRLAEKLNFLEEIDSSKLLPETIVKLMDLNRELENIYVAVSVLEGNFESGFPPESWEEYSRGVKGAIDLLDLTIKDLIIR
ncbi:hypothetical protein LC065_12590 [Halobacillus litoralis]|uniref:hypothetical protein n=1 Tax=Halobacillus litoralis TaxID=45668 RepID=UPI001CFF3831|nr:hypothetical protein [Halobacillus litoralis]WLR46415.1 hypothetical protein LC065_12590 [Halobacillus litoralis]